MNRQELIRKQWEFDGEIGGLANQPKITAPIPPYSSPEIPDNARFWAVEIGLKCCNNPKTKWLYCWTLPDVHIFDLLDDIETQTINDNEEIREYIYLSPEVIEENEANLAIDEKGWLLPE